MTKRQARTALVVAFRVVGAAAPPVADAVEGAAGSVVAIPVDAAGVVSTAGAEVSGAAVEVGATLLLEAEGVVAARGVPSTPHCSAAAETLVP